MDIIATERDGRKFALTDLCILSSMKTNRKLKQHGYVLDELLTPAMQFLKQPKLAKPHNHPSDKTAVEIEKDFHVELASTLKVANHISNIFVRYDHWCSCSQFILVCK